VDLFRSRLDQIINMKHEPVCLARAIDWSALETRAVHGDGVGIPPLRRLMPRLSILNHGFSLADEELCDRG